MMFNLDTSIDINIFKIIPNKINYNRAYNRYIDVVNFDFTVSNIFKYNDYVDYLIKYDILLKGYNELNYFLNFLDDVKGIFKSFWMPVYKYDLNLYTNIYDLNYFSNSFILHVEKNGFIYKGYEKICYYDEFNNKMIVRDLLNIEDAGDYYILYIDIPFNCNLKTRLLDFVIYGRFINGFKLSFYDSFYDLKVKTEINFKEMSSEVLNV